MNTIDEIDTGSSIPHGFFKISILNKKNEIIKDKFKFSLGQIISGKENRNILSKSTLNEKLSDVILKLLSILMIIFKISSDFLLDQNLKEFNKNKINLDLVYPSTVFNVSYLEESQHIGNQKYFN